MRQPDRSASSTRRTPSTPTLPDSVGRPPRRAMRNSLSQRLSRLVIVLARGLGGRGPRAALTGEAIPGSVTNFIGHKPTSHIRLGALHAPAGVGDASNM